ncbi:hypothetical protein [uncultured Cocleimonas sp.]|uniref:hypothetical protein n=1 Tax=uncultured Cocleimonas sp. TaxID=1051587 RepID=UPI002631EF4F|nr:hypothetical protein [uncultured Cocleimonas sp.]
MYLKPQDILFLLKLLAIKKESWAYNSLALELGMSTSEVHASAKRSLYTKLAIEDEVFGIRPNTINLSEFLNHGIQYSFAPQKGGMVRGLATSFAAEPLAEKFIDNNELPSVWPDPEGNIRGLSFSPLYKSAPNAAKKDSDLYELLVLVDAIRGGGSREKAIAIELLEEKIKAYVEIKKEEIKNE